MYVGMIMRALNTLPGQDDSEKLVTNQKLIEELNATVDSLKNELSEKTNRIEELCRLANDFRDDTDRIKTELFKLQENHMLLIQAYQLKENELESYRRLLEMHGIWQNENPIVNQQQEPMVNATPVAGELPPIAEALSPLQQQQQYPHEDGTMAHQRTLEESFRNDLNV
uniref:Uncharacterized protein n=1 Tax=Schizaphis graminum TaxID=13262 RepID=A0A2S2PBI5_SCHGA